MSRRPLIAANWKMFLDQQQARNLASGIVAGLDGGNSAEVVLFPSFPLLAAVAAELEGSPVALGGQDLHPAPEGAFTGDVSGRQLADLGCRFVLCGHSERRRDHGETDELVVRKMAAAVDCGLTPIVCVGESLDERRGGLANSVLARQVDALLELAPPDLVIAYEPVWAIGTGEVATPELAESAHATIRDRLTRGLGSARAEATRVLYGGSVKANNAGALKRREGIDGFLVGGASLDVASFLGIITGSAQPG